MIFRATAQWFIPMEGPGELREQARPRSTPPAACPARGRNRIGSMVESRPDWCISRQRAWGVPIAVFVHKGTGEVLRDPEVVERIAAAFEEEGADAWCDARPAVASWASATGPRTTSKVDDILDVWFDSGCTHAFVLERAARAEMAGRPLPRGLRPAPRLVPVARCSRAAAPAAGRRSMRVLTHGFVVDAEGRKMSKSLGNGMSPSDLMKSHGADILRLWVVSTDYAEDIRIGKEILDGPGDSYRRLRNTLRYILGNLAGFTEAERLPPEQMPELERWVLHRVAEIDALVRECNDSFDFPRLYSALHNFCAIDLSAFYFDVRKDALYCDPLDSTAPPRGADRARQLFSCLTAWLAPVLVLHRRGGLAAAGAVRGRQRAPAHLPRRPGRLARRGSGRALGAGARACAASSPGPWRSSGARSGSAPACRPPRPSTSTPPTGRRWKASTSPSSRITSGIELLAGPPPRARSRCPTCRAWRSSRPRPTGASAPAAGASCRRSGPSAGELCHRCEDALGRVAADEPPRRAGRPGWRWRWRCWRPTS